MITDGNGNLLATILTGANRHDVTQLIPLVVVIPVVRGKRGQPRRRPNIVQGDRGHDSQPHRDELPDQPLCPAPLPERHHRCFRGLARRTIVNTNLIMNGPG